MEYKGARYAFADLSRLGGLTYAPLKALGLGFDAVGMRKTSQILDITAHALPYCSLMYASLTSRGIPNETLAHKATRATALFATGSLLIPGLFGSFAGHQEIPEEAYQDTEWAEPVEQAASESASSFASSTLLSAIAGIANTVIPMALKSKFGKRR